MADDRTVQAVSVGPVAARIIAGGAVQGRLLSVFKSTLWISCPEGAFCVTHSGIAPGPLNVVASAGKRTDWTACGLRAGDRVLVSARVLRLGLQARVVITGAEIWTPDDIVLTQYSEGVRKLRGACLEQRVKPQGLGSVCFERVHDQTLLHMQSRSLVAAARLWVETGSGGMDWATSLVGRGPGLTPAGDDFLGGMIIGLRLADHKSEADKLWAAIREHARRSTGPISFALLSAAAEGYGNAPLHRALECLGRGAEPTAYLADIRSMGHSSGWDALAGAITALAPLAGGTTRQAA